MITMNRFTMVLATAALVLPAISRAGSGAAEDNGCVKALMSSLAETYHPVPKLRSVSLLDAGGAALNGGEAAEWTLTAINPRTNLPVAKVDCITNAMGQVVDFRKRAAF
ncbi:MAG: hypothetical protein KGL25_12215 [Gammaproteobacteria bacterium]|nr:hypothetical protein [Gammaproteobacteria bacterium]